MPHPVLRFFRSYAWPHRAAFAAGFACLALTNWLTVEIPVQVGAALDAYAGGAPTGGPIAAVAAMGVGVILVRTLSRVLIFNPARTLEHQLRVDLFAHLLQQPPAFWAGRSTGDIISRASNDITYARVLVGFGLMQAVNVAAALGFATWKMLSLSVPLSLYALIPIVLATMAARGAIERVMRLHRQGQEQLSDLSGHILASLQGISSIQGFGAEPSFIARFDARADALLRTRTSAIAVASLAFPALSVGGSVAVFVLLWVGGPMALAGELTVGEVAAFATLLGVLLPPLRGLGWMISVLQRGQVSVERIYELLDTAPARPEGPSPRALPATGAPAVRVRGLRFAYPDAPATAVLDGVDLDLPAGAVVGVFGPTGSGKTTLLRLLARLHDAPAGAIEVDGVPLDAVDRGAWQARVAMAPQRPFLFSDTISENIEISADAPPDAPPGAPIDPARRDRALRRAALTPDLASLPAGVDTLVGERGIMLSGGQRQRVALARALYKDGDLVLLDDVLSAVDHQTESELVGAPGGLGLSDRRPTVVIVSHRVSALRHCDRVVVLDAGRVVDQGSPAELLQRPGPFLETALAQRPEGVSA